MLKLFTKIIAAVVSLITAALPAVFGSYNKNRQPCSDILPETWAAVDGLGRTLPMKGEVKEKDETKFVGMFYWIWHTTFAETHEAKNATEILAEHPDILHDFDSPFWGGTSSGYPHFWNKPLFGYYRDTDAYVLRKHAELIADAGVDVIIFDCTNGTATWDESYEKLFEVFEDAKADGVNVPKIAFMLPFNDGEDTTVSLKNLYERIYSKGRYKNLWFYWDKKPFIMAHSSGLHKKDKTEKEILRFFTFREDDPAYFSSDREYKKKIWGWCSDYPQTRYGVSRNGKIEQMCVSVAQNAADGQLVAMNSGENVQGRSFTKDGYSYSFTAGGRTITAETGMDDSVLYGLNFQQQWDYAIEEDPSFIFVTGWNEWVAGRWDEWQGTKNAFPDQFSDEYSRDIEPADGILKDHYYYQLAANIRRFKGISAETEQVGDTKIYHHYQNSTLRRDSDGWVGLHYSSDTMRNDFVRAEVRNDSRFVYFRIVTKDDVDLTSGRAPIRIYLDTDKSGTQPGWEGFEYVINRDNAGENTVKVERILGAERFEQTGSARYTVTGNVMDITLPLEAVVFDDPKDPHFNFKLSDNLQTDGDIMDFYKNGDVAPGGRFMFVY